MLTPEQKKELHNAAERLNRVKPCERKDILESLAKLLGLSVKSVRRHLAVEAGWKPAQKVRADKGKSVITQEYALLTAGIAQKAKRATGKLLLSTKNIQGILENNNILPVNEDGEVKTVSTSTLRRKMIDYNLHNAVLKKDSPAQAQRSLHPNHVWELDASVCVLFYLPGNKVMLVDEKAAYKNKPDNLEKVNKDKVIRYVITDHYSGYIYVRYSTGAEDAQGVLDTLIEAMSKRSDTDPMHGVPEILLMDKGAGNTSGLIKAFCENLHIEPIFHKTGNPRAKGQVENAQNLVEKNFEGRLRFYNITGLAELQAACDAWRAHYNSREILRRAGKPRAMLWTSIKSEQLRICEKDVLQEIACWKNVTRKIDSNFNISVSTKKFGKPIYHVADLSLHGVGIGQEVKVYLNPFTAPDITVKAIQIDGSHVQADFSPIAFDEAGFRADAPVIGEEYTAFKKQENENNLEKIEKLAYAADTVKAAEEKKLKNEKPFQNIDFMADIKKSPVYLHAPGKPVFEKEPAKLSLSQMAMEIARRSELWKKSPKQSLAWLRAQGTDFNEIMVDELVTKFNAEFELKQANIIEFQQKAAF